MIFNDIYIEIITILKMTEIIGKAIKLLFGSFDQNALIEGASDIIVVKW